MSELTVVVAPKLKQAMSSALQVLDERDFTALFLNLPRNLDPYVTDLAEGLPYSFVMDELRRSGLIPEPFNAWRYFAEPLLRRLVALKLVRPEVQLKCYKSVGEEMLAIEDAIRIAQLTLRATLTRRVDVKDWRAILREESARLAEAFEDEIEYVSALASPQQSSICLAGVAGLSYKERFERRGLTVKVESFGFPYQLQPLETILDEYCRQREAVTDGRIEHFVRMHLEYVREFVIRSDDLDKAYNEWAKGHRGQTPIVEASGSKTDTDS